MITRTVRKYLAAATLLSCSALLHPLPAEATPTDTGWSLPCMALEMSFPVINPDGCPWGGYVIAPDMTGYETFQSLAMSACFAGRQVALTIDGCTSNRPKIVSVKVRG